LFTSYYVTIMSSPTKREVYHDPRETQPRQRRSSRLNRKLQGCHSKKSNSSKDSKMPKIIKSSSSTENPKLETLHSSNMRSPTVIKIHGDSDNSRSKSSSKVSFWKYPDLSPGIETILNARNLSDSSGSVIISINLCNINNMIQLSNLDLEDLSKFFSRKDLSNSVLQDIIVQVYA
jgi:hypothetical protein